LRSLELGVVEAEAPIKVSGLCSICTIWSQVAGKCVQYDRSCFEKLGELAPMDSQSIIYKFKVPENAEEGKYSFKIDVYYKVEGESYEILRTGVIEVVRNKGYVLGLKFNQSEAIYSDSIGEIEIEVVNQGDEINDLRLIFNSSQFLSILGTNEYYIGNLLPNGRRAIKLNLYVAPEATTGIYLIPVVLAYSNADRTRQFLDTKVLGIKVSSNPDIDLYIDEVTSSSPSSLEVELKIFNKGVSTAKYVIVKANSSVLKVENPMEYIGSLEGDDFDLVRFKFQVLGNVTRKVPIEFVVSYQTGMGETRNVSKTFEVDIMKASETRRFSGAQYGILALGIPIFSLLILIIVVAVIVLIWIVFRKKKK